MKRRMADSTTRILSVVLVLALLVLVSEFASAQPRSVTSFFVEEAKLTAPDGSEWDSFGYSVSVSGDTIVVGASGDNGRGSAYIFERVEGTANWVQVAKLTASDGVVGDVFGASISISGDTVVVGAFLDDDSGQSSGSAYLFESPEGGWIDASETAKLTASDGAASDYFGHSVSVSGDTVVVGAPLDDDGADRSGSVYVFEKPEGGWSDLNETAKLTASEAVPVGFLGRSVSISADTVVAGAYGDDDNGEYSGSAYLFEKPVSGWIDMTETTKLKASDGAPGDYFGVSVSVDGDTVVVGAFLARVSGAECGSAYLFEKPVTGWTDMTETAKLSASDGAGEDYFGYSVSVSGDTAVVGADGDDDSESSSGSAYVFERPGTSWTDITETTKLTATDGNGFDIFGWSVSNSGGTVVVGAQGDSDNGEHSGSAYVYAPFRASAWVYLPVVLR